MILFFNDNSLTSKTLRQTIMPRSKLKNIYKKCKIEDNWSNYKKHRNLC